jgi:hypothetical protein
MAQPSVAPYFRFSGCSVESYVTSTSGTLIGDWLWEVPHSGVAAQPAWSG